MHELVHMYDHCKFKVDWSNLRHHACSEVRGPLVPSYSAPGVYNCTDLIVEPHRSGPLV